MMMYLQLISFNQCRCIFHIFVCSWFRDPSFICQKVCFQECQDWRLVVYSVRGIWCGGQQLDEYMDKAKRIPSCQCKTQGWYVGIRAGLLHLTYEHLNCPSSLCWFIVTAKVSGSCIDITLLCSHNSVQMALLGMGNGLFHWHYFLGWTREQQILCSKVRMEIWA